jgi:hypothetical protein
MRVYNLTASQFGLSNIALRRLKVARFHDLNDPFEMMAVDVANRALRVGMSAKKKQIHSREGLLCFSEDWRSPLIWSHYAEKHKGLALGFDVPDNLLIRVRYQGGMHKISVAPGSTDQKTIDRLLDRLRYTKFDGWKYEAEVRQFFPLNTLDEQSGLYFVPFSETLVLREVVLGPRCDLPIDSIRDLVEPFSQKVYVRRSRIAFKKFAVVEDRRFRSKVGAARSSP